MDKTVSLVSGGAGFIGTNLIKRLLDREHFVICVDSLWSGSKDNVTQFENNPNFEFIHRDISSLRPNVFAEKFPDVKIDNIYHLASIASPERYMKQWLETIYTNVNGTMVLLNLADKHDAKFFLASTSEVYGDPLEHPQKETYFGNVNPIGPRACYDESKRLAETMTMEYHNKRGVNIRIARIFNTFGPYMQIDDGRAIPNFINAAINNKTIEIYGDGNQTRSCCYIDDLLDGIDLLMNSDFKTPINLGNDVEISIADLAKTVCDLTGYDYGNVIFFPYHEMTKDDPKRRQPDLSFAREGLGYVPGVRYQKGLKKTIEWFIDTTGGKK